MNHIVRVTLCLLACVFIAGCANHLYFGTATTVGLGVAGTAKVPTKVSFAYDRTETAIVPDDSEGHAHSVFASLDSEWTWWNGFIVEQKFATGEAADIVAKDSKVTVTYKPRPGTTSEKPLLFTTSSKLGIAIDVGETPESPASLLVGYRRYEATMMPHAKGRATLDPVYADISIIADDKGIANAASGPRLGGARIKQRFATGAAAINAVSDDETKQYLRGAVLGDPVLRELETAKQRFDQEAAVQKRFSTLSSEKKGAYLKVLNETFGRSAVNAITEANLQVELGKLHDTQLQVAADQIRKF